MIGNRSSRTALAVCVLFALNGCITGDNSGDEVEPDLSTATENLALPPPTNVTATAVSPTRIDVTWNAVPGDLQYYIVDRGTAPGAETTLTSVPPNKTTWISTNLTPGQQYCWDIRTLNSANEVSGKSNESCATTPGQSQTAAPTGVTAVAISSSRITVSWNAVSGATVYHVYMAQQNANPVYSLVATVTAPTTTATIANLLSATTYLFTVSAVAPSGESPRSSPPVSATTVIPGLEGYWKFDERTGTRSVDRSGHGRDATLTGGTFSTAGLPPVDVANASVLVGPAAGTAATVAGNNAFRFAGADYTLSAWVKLRGATGDLAGIATAGCTQTAWKLSQGATGGVTLTSNGATAPFGFTLAANVWTHVAFSYAEGTGTLLTYINGVQTSSRSFTPRNSLTNSVPLSFGALCNGGAANLDEISIYSRALTAAEVALLGKIPPATTARITVQNASTETISWTAVPGVDQYYLYKGTAAGNEQYFTSVPGNLLSFVGQHLSPLTTYTWFVRTTTGGLPYSTSNEVTATTPDVLAAPTGLTASVVAGPRANVKWNQVAGATSYKVFLSTKGGAFVQVATTLPPVVSVQLAKLTAKTAYRVEVQAVDSGDNDGHLTNPVSFTTP
ncbi:MAG TPA: fibronectin type III domain-containing protein [Kofleriaceae bacterium]